MAMALIVTGDVIARKFFNISMTGSDEIGGYVTAITSSWAFAYALFRRAHISIDTVTVLLPRHLRAVSQIVGLGALGIFMTLMAVRCWNVFVLSVEFNSTSMTPLKIPLWIPQGLWVFGLFFFVAVIGLLLAKSLTALARGDAGTVSRLIGTLSAESAEAAGDIGREPKGVAPPPKAGA
jgi:TRAP-type C4-dicarboxylate transport system permease small subunit